MAPVSGAERNCRAEKTEPIRPGGNRSHSQYNTVSVPKGLVTLVLHPPAMDLKPKWP